MKLANSLGRDLCPCLEAGIGCKACRNYQATAAKILFRKRSYRFFVSATGPGDGLE